MLFNKIIFLSLFFSISSFAQNLLEFNLDARTLYDEMRAEEHSIIIYNDVKEVEYLYEKTVDNETKPTGQNVIAILMEIRTKSNNKYKCSRYFYKIGGELNSNSLFQPTLNIWKKTSNTICTPIISKQNDNLLF